MPVALDWTAVDHPLASVRNKLTGIWKPIRDLWIDAGDAVTARPGFTAVLPRGKAGDSILVVADNSRTIFNGFLGSNFESGLIRSLFENELALILLTDTDGDGIPNSIELANGLDPEDPADAKGDPYVGELHGRIKTAWKVPSLETRGGVALGCVRLAADGSIDERKLWKPSGNQNLNRSVDQALRDASDMDKPVPSHLTNLLIVQGICFRFKLDD